MVALTIITANSFAQVQSDIQSATLIHGDKTSVYYGITALNSAYEEAEDGDVIVLSAGIFGGVSYGAPTIRKSITIYGAGYEEDPVSNMQPTLIYSPLWIDDAIDDTDADNIVHTSPVVRIEGVSSSLRINSNIKNLVVRKCKMTVMIDGETTNCTFSQCVIHQINRPGSVYSYTLKHQTGLNFENCWINFPAGGPLGSGITYNHCIIRSDWSSGYKPYGTYDVGYAHFTNSIVYGGFSDTSHSTGDYNILPFKAEYLSGVGNWEGVSADAIWAVEGEDGTYAATKSFALLHPELYVGSDGTEIGINGGNAPFNRISPIPRILDADVDIRTAADGKLNVNFKVEAQTKE